MGSNKTKPLKPRRARIKACARGFAESDDEDTAYCPAPEEDDDEDHAMSEEAEISNQNDKSMTDLDIDGSFQNQFEDIDDQESTNDVSESDNSGPEAAPNNSERSCDSSANFTNSRSNATLICSILKLPAGETYDTVVQKYKPQISELQNRLSDKEHDLHELRLNLLNQKKDMVVALQKVAEMETCLEKNKNSQNATFQATTEDDNIKGMSETIVRQRQAAKVEERYNRELEDLKHRLGHQQTEIERAQSTIEVQEGKIMEMERKLAKTESDIQDSKFFEAETESEVKELRVMKEKADKEIKELKAFKQKVRETDRTLYRQVMWEKKESG